MKLPKTFIPKKDLEKELERLLKGQVYNYRNVAKLFDSCEEFLQSGAENFESQYFEGGRLAKKLDYTEDDLRFLSQNLRLNHPDDASLGVYLSVLVDKIVPKGGEITLKINEELNGIGAYLKNITLTIEGSVQSGTGFCMNKGKLIIQGNAKRTVGYLMRGGKIIIEGNVDDLTGCYMQGGSVLIRGNAGFHTGYCMKNGLIWVLGDAGKETGAWMYGGRLRVDGKIESMYTLNCKGTIYHKDKKIWPK